MGIFCERDCFQWKINFRSMEWGVFENRGVVCAVVVAIQNKKPQPAKSTIFCPSNLNKYWAVKHFAKIYARLFDQLSTKCPNLNMNFAEKYFSTYFLASLKYRLHIKAWSFYGRADSFRVRFFCKDGWISCEFCLILCELCGIFCEFRLIFCCQSLGQRLTMRGQSRQSTFRHSLPSASGGEVGWWVRVKILVF